jgi:hypothetical protein
MYLIRVYVVIFEICVQAPELIEDSSKHNEATDVYALGMVCLSKQLHVNYSLFQRCIDYTCKS